MNYAESILNLRREEAQGRAKLARRRERARVRAMPRYNRVFYRIHQCAEYYRTGFKRWRPVPATVWAQEMGVSAGTIRNWLKGRAPCPRMAVRFAQLLLQCRRYRCKHNALLKHTIL